MPDKVNILTLNRFTVLANPVKRPGYLRVNMTAAVADVAQSPLYYADTNLWDDHYVFHLHHSGGVDFGTLNAAKEELGLGRPFQFEMECFMHQLEQIGFVGVPRG